MCGCKAGCKCKTSLKCSEMCKCLDCENLEHEDFKAIGKNALLEEQDIE